MFIIGNKSQNVSFGFVYFGSADLGGKAVGLGYKVIGC